MAVPAHGEAAMLVTADLHVHLGQDPAGHPVKIPSSRAMTLEAVVARARAFGLDAVGLVDGLNPCLGAALESWVAEGRAVPFEAGYHLPESGLALLVGVECELPLPGAGQWAHYVWFPARRADLARRLGKALERLRNPCLSTPRLPVDPQEVASWGGVFFPAHAFTPFRGALALWPSLYPPKVRWLELGLSANTAMAAAIPALAEVTFLTHSDAHSLEMVGREFTCYDAGDLTPDGVWEAVFQGRVVANVGVPPALGKYHRARCRNGHFVEPPDLAQCPECGAEVVRGVAPRILALGGAETGSLPRPPYRERVPWAWVPGFGPGRLSRVRRAFSDLAAREVVDPAWFEAEVGRGAGLAVHRLRRGELQLFGGGGGRWGRVVLDEAPSGRGQV
ncbi:MAG: endonuclease Q family protein [Firmicutes bacterium]|nr:hypothetical protein [Alicyclobacillaceae bacterium]MCL6496694.1 endonuclease Q family protein [Bacillota bacterium]